MANVGGAVVSRVWHNDAVDDRDTIPSPPPDSGVILPPPPDGYDPFERFESDRVAALMGWFA